MARHPNVGRLDRIIRELQQLHDEAQGIYDAHIEVECCRSPSVPFGTVKMCEIAGPAGSSLNYIKALKIVRGKITGQPYPGE
jgi:hypothetical protein